MFLDLAYSGRSRVDGGAVTLAPNLRRPPVSLDAELANPLRFREAISALHDVVISDLRFQRRERRPPPEDNFHEVALAHAREEVELRRLDLPEDLPEQFAQARREYWEARREYGTWLRSNDPGLWRKLMPYDPVITVAPDAVLFECFSADESCYACLTVERDAMFKSASSVQLGTTNVDYSWDLFDEFQQLRTYRSTRFQVDPGGFTVGATREEKIELPDSWLRGFMQIQAGMMLPLRKIPLDRECVYSILAYLRRHRARKSPRALQFDLRPGEPPIVELQPFGVKILSRTTRWEGRPEIVKLWGRQRLLVLARLLPLVESVDVHVIGSGMPSFWLAKMGEMRFTLGLSGWTVNDWTRSAALDLMAPTTTVDVAPLARELESRQLMRIDDRSAAHRLAAEGLCIHDLALDLVRWRRVMPPEIRFIHENEEAMASRGLHVHVSRDQRLATGLRFVAGDVQTREVEILLDEDGVFKRAKCACSHFYKGGLRKGPCRHLLALRAAVWKT